MSSTPGPPVVIITAGRKRRRTVSRKHSRKRRRGGDGDEYEGKNPIDYNNSFFKSTPFQNLLKRKRREAERMYPGNKTSQDKMVNAYQAAQWDRYVEQNPNLRRPAPAPPRRQSPPPPRDPAGPYRDKPRWDAPRPRPPPARTDFRDVADRLNQGQSGYSKLSARLGRSGWNRLGDFAKRLGFGKKRRKVTRRH
jgi:hypothetical protein